MAVGIRKKELFEEAFNEGPDIEENLIEAEEAEELSFDNVSGEDEERNKEEEKGRDSREVSGNPLTAYFREVYKGRLLSAEEERILAVRSAKGDGDARKTLIECNLRLVIKIAKHYVNRGMAFSDLIEEGNIGLIIGVDRFEVEKGYRLITYARWWIRQSIERALANQMRAIRVPIRMHEFLNRRRKLIKKLFQELGREPGIDELERCMVAEDIQQIEERTGLPVKKRVEQKMLMIVRAKLWRAGEVEARGNPIPLASVSDDGEVTNRIELFLEDKGDTPEIVMQRKELTDKIIPGAMNALARSEQEVIRQRFGMDDGIERTLVWIGLERNVTRERARQIEAAALEKMRAYLLCEQDKAAMKRAMFNNP